MQLLNLLFLVAPISRVMWDWYEIEVKKRGIEYFKHNTVTAATIVLIALQLHIALDTPILKAVAFGWGLYEILFDYGLNFFRRKPVFTYFGDFTDTKNLSPIEEYVYARISWQLITILKVVFFLLTTYYYGN